MKTSCCRRRSNQSLPEPSSPVRYGRSRGASIAAGRATRRCGHGACCSRALRQGTSLSVSQTREVALMGELSAQTLAARGVLGFVVDGGSRDTELVIEQGFPVFCSFLTPADIVSRWLPDRYGEPVTIGAVTISTGDYLLGDRDRVVVIPAAAVEEVIAKTEDV